MSFATEVKNELCFLDYSDNDVIVLLSGFVRNNYSIVDGCLVLSTENAKIARFLFSMFKRIYDVNVIINQGSMNNFKKKSSYNVVISDKVSFILNDLMIIDYDGNETFIDDLFVSNEDLKRDYLRGCFLASGSVNDPKTSRYHLEFLVDRIIDAKFISSLLSVFYINSKIIDRDKGYMVYVKEAEKIGDFLRVISANKAVMYYEDIRIYRDHKNMTNRLNNCEQANVDKIIDASSKQIEDINIIVNKLGLDLVDSKVKDVIVYRLKYPEVSLGELSNIMSYETGKSITKSGLNHRFRKIHEIANRLREE
jgi:DNA-binding protein WhiA